MFFAFTHQPGAFRTHRNNYYFGASILYHLLCRIVYLRLIQIFNI